MLTRFGHSSSQSAMTLAVDHPAIIEGRSLFRKSANEHKRHKSRVLVSAFNSRKIGKIVTRGSLIGAPIFTLTLEERKTCPTDCSMWRSCYGNRMPWSLRWQAGKETEARVEAELAELQAAHPKGFLVRLHVLGDFYSVKYVGLWEQWLKKYPALYVYGYTARSCDIGKAVKKLSLANWARFAIRSSNGMMPGLPPTYAVKRGEPTNGIVCPVETDKSATCGTCALCWDAPKKTIVFLEH